MTMKRRRKSASSETQLSKKDDDRIQIQLSGPSINDLPAAIVFDIVLKLPVKSIVMCKSVCKTWHSLISDPRFVELHLARSKTQTLIRNKDCLKFSRSLYLLEPEDVCGLDSGYCPCRANSAENCKHLHFNTTVASKLKIPLRNSQVMLDKVKNGHGDDAMFCATSKSGTKNLNKLKPYDHRYDVASSCNGLLLLSLRRIIPWRPKPIVVCNPLTGEFAYLPEDYDGLLHGGLNYFEFGLGFSPKHNQYKAIRVSYQWRTETFDGFKYVAQIHTLGTASWRNIDMSAFEPGFLCSPAYLDGALHWVFKDIHRGGFKLASFDLDQEIFQIHCLPSPPPLHDGTEFPELALTVIGGRLYLYSDLVCTHMVIWVMYSNGISKSWINLFFFDVSKFHGVHKYHRYQLISILKESLVMFGGPFGEFVYYDKSDGPRFKQLKCQCLSSEFEAISCTPSFISLKDVEVLNINSGCGKLKLLEETYPLLLQGGKN